MSLSLTGRKFTRLQVVGKTVGHVSGTPVKWDCVCDCGAERSINGTVLVQGKTRSCGCLRREMLIGSAKDWTGVVCGRLTPIRAMPDRRGGPVVWECQCLCGNRTYVRVGDLCKTTRSCGRLQRDAVVRKNYKHGLSKTPGMKDFYRSQRKAAQLLRTPPWADMDAIRDIYRLRPEGLQVDHVVPLRGEIVSGLHVAENLQYLTKSDNCGKNNHFAPQFIAANP